MASDVATTVGLRAAATIVHNDMKKMFGHYQAAASPFPAWAPLAPSTIAERISLGYPANEPLLRSGDLRDSYNVKGGPMWAGVGSPLEKALVQEVGDPGHNLPARSTLGIAFVRAERLAFAAGCAPLFGLLAGGRRGMRAIKSIRVEE